jgi:hypothetical protein
VKTKYRTGRPATHIVSLDGITIVEKRPDPIAHGGGIGGWNRGWQPN